MNEGSLGRLAHDGEIRSGATHMRMRMGKLNNAAAAVLHGMGSGEGRGRATRASSRSETLNFAGAGGLKIARRTVVWLDYIMESEELGRDVIGDFGQIENWDFEGSSEQLCTSAHDRRCLVCAVEQGGLSMRASRGNVHEGATIADAL